MSPPACPSQSFHVPSPQSRARAQRSPKGLNSGVGYVKARYRTGPRAEIEHEEAHLSDKTFLDRPPSSQPRLHGAPLVSHGMPRAVWIPDLSADSESHATKAVQLNTSRDTAATAPGWRRKRWTRPWVISLAMEPPRAAKDA
ncbi:hypothetical protein V2G26_004942 [Clonostachys chloroleuca]